MRPVGRLALLCLFSILHCFMFTVQAAEVTPDMATKPNDPNTLRFGTLTSLSMPIANVFIGQSGIEVSDEGMHTEISQAIAKALNMTVHYVPTEREDALSYLMNGEIDVLCFMVPQWLGAPPSSVTWSKVFLRIQDILISRKNHIAPIRTLRDLQERNIGLVRHYRYPLLDNLIERQLTFPVYASNEQTNFFQLFKNNNIDAIVIKDITFEYLFNDLKGPLRDIKVMRHPLVVEFADMRCALSRHKAINIEQVNKGIDRYIEHSGHILTVP